MLRVVLGVTLLLIVALVGYRRTFTGLRLPRGARIILLTGTEFILVGVALGSSMLDVLDEETIRRLTPLFSLALGYVGLIYGIQLERDKIRRFPPRYLVATVVQSVVTFVVILVPSFWVFDLFESGGGSTVWLAALVLAAAGANTGQTTLALLVRELRVRGSQFLYLLRYIDSLDAIVGVTAIGVAFAMAHPSGPVPLVGAPALQWFVLSALLGVALGLLLHLVTQYHCTEEELVVFGLGMVLFAGGIATYLKLSPLFVNMMLGITMANLPGAHDRLFNLLIRLEKPFYLLLLILAGAIWHVGSLTIVGFASVYLLLRMAGKALGGYLASHIVTPEVNAPRTMGFALTSLGGVAIAIVLSYYTLFPGDLNQWVVTAVLGTVMANEFLSPGMIRLVLGATPKEAR
ncbi:MAG: hypothetical protein JRI23_14555 [Deltaproteobacteria bacterium]|nr:hypothetical protein [Deltaproteobacteria bacterium]MBW2532970.1 hypothetical protein [Deltaproteobacteria bacterium]